MISRIAAAALLVVALPALGTAQTPDPPPPAPAPDFQPFVGKRIKEVWFPNWGTTSLLRVRAGRDLQIEDIRATERSLQQRLAEMRADEPIQPRLAISIASTEVTPKDDGVSVNFSIKEILLTETDSPGRAIDENTIWMTTARIEYPEFTTRYFQDRRVGTAFGSEVHFARHTTQGGRLIVPNASAWMSVNHKLFGAQFDLGIVPGLSSRARRFTCGPQLNTTRLPAGAAVFQATALRAGCDYRFVSPLLASWAGNLSYRASDERLTADFASYHMREHAIEFNGVTETQTNGGFLRIAPWMDYSWNADHHSYERFGMIVRSYQEWFGSLAKASAGGITTNVVFSTGLSWGVLPLTRLFTAGDRLNEPLLESTFRPEDYWLAGPLVRGVGVSQLPPGNALAGSNFAGVSVTVGLPGYAQLLFARELRDPVYRAQLDAAQESLTTATVARTLSEYLAIEDSPEAARRRAAARLEATKATLRNLISHAKQLSVRPIVAADYGRLWSLGDPGGAIWTAGFGLRVASGPGTVTILSMWNHGAPADLGPWSVSVRFNLLWNRSDFTSS